MSINAPCKDCPDRKVTEDYNCHSHCEGYLLYKEKHEEYVREQQLEAELNSYSVEKDIRIRKALGGKK